MFGVGSLRTPTLNKEEAQGNGGGKKRLSGQSNKGTSKRQKQEESGGGGPVLRKCKRCKKSTADSFLLPVSGQLHQLQQRPSEPQEHCESKRRGGVVSIP